MSKIDIIYNKSCLPMDEIDNKSVDMIFSDPPFNIGKDYGPRGDRRSDYYEWCEEWIDKCFQKLKDTGTFYLMTLTRHLEKLFPMLGSRGVFINQVMWRNVSASHSKRGFWNSYQPILVYGKTKDYIFNTYAQTRTILKKNLRWGGYSTQARGQLLDYWDDIPFVYAGSIHHQEAILKPGTNEKAHICQMPIALAVRAILFSTNKGDIISAPFIGSGTTAIACKRTNRHYIGYEINEHYYNDIILPRLEAEKTLWDLTKENQGGNIEKMINNKTKNLGVLPMKIMNREV